MTTRSSNSVNAGRDRMVKFPGGRAWAEEVSVRRDADYHSTLPRRRAARKKWKRSAVVAIGLIALLASGCSSRRPYEGKSVAELQAMLADARPSVQAQGAYGLSRLGADAQIAVPELKRALSSPDTLVRMNAALALAKIGPGAAEAVPALIEALRDPQWSVRRQAAIALGSIGAAADPAIPRLEQLAGERDKLVSAAAREAIKTIKDARRKDGH